MSATALTNPAPEYVLTYVRFNCLYVTLLIIIQLAQQGRPGLAVNGWYAGCSSVDSGTCDSLCRVCQEVGVLVQRFTITS